MHPIKACLAALLFAFLSHGAFCEGDATAHAAGSGKKTPLFAVRALHIQLRRSTGGDDPVRQTKEDVLGLIRRASRSGFNVLMLQVNSAVRLESEPRFASRWSYSKDEIRAFIAAAKQGGMEVIPAINLLTHQDEMMLNIDRDLMLNDYDYDPNRPEVYKVVFPILDELIRLFQPKRILIGHDEAFGVRIKQAMRPPARSLKPEEFLSDTIRIHDYLKRKHVGTMMWADMLLDPEIYGAHYHPAEYSGYAGFAALLEKLPRDIILCDWHYLRKNSPDFPSYTDLQKKGFTVWGAVWKYPETIRSFSAYVAKHARGNEGMIATLWWPSVTQEKEVIDLILETSSRAFHK